MVGKTRDIWTRHIQSPFLNVASENDNSWALKGMKHVICEVLKGSDAHKGDH